MSKVGPGIAQQDFLLFPPVGGDDWRYAFATARVRALETQMLSRSMLLDLANAGDWQSAMASLASTSYGLAGDVGAAALEGILIDRRSAARRLFDELVADIEPELSSLFRSRIDFVNLRLALRRMVSDRPVGGDYCPDGNVGGEQIEKVFGDENFGALPEYMREAVEQAILEYYQEKDIRRIDYAVDRVECEHYLEQARRLGSVFLEGLFMIRADLANIRTMLRLRLLEYRPRGVFLEGGFLETGIFSRAVDAADEAVTASFYATPYSRVVELSVAYLTSRQSFLRAEQQCRHHMEAFLDTTSCIVAGHQSVVAHLLKKESEIRTIRFLLTARRHGLEPEPVLDLIGG